MKDEEVRCIYSDWKIIDNNDNHDYVCVRDNSWLTGAHLCYCDKNCKFYQPNEVKDTEKL